jgi:hypothetical protein
MHSSVHLEPRGPVRHERRPAARDGRGRRLRLERGQGQKRQAVRLGKTGHVEIAPTAARRARVHGPGFAAFAPWFFPSTATAREEKKERPRERPAWGGKDEKRKEKREEGSQNDELEKPAWGRSEGGKTYLFPFFFSLRRPVHGTARFKVQSRSRSKQSGQRSKGIRTCAAGEGRRKLLSRGKAPRPGLSGLRYVLTKC